ncbi:hypothetical protein [Streptomyces sp. CAU 1734]|uniref:hypothetical protein n=1 Tax=Streptomyces sp. CAU 1734 TaxID=3140360 RepID=UPI003261142D
MNQAQPITPVTVRPVKYAVCALPENNINYRHYMIEVQHRGKGRWAVTQIDRCLGADGTWAEGIKPYGRGEQWLADHRFDLDTALRLASEAAPHIVVNGYTVADALSD